jgi:hypothetical protein
VRESVTCSRRLRSLNVGDDVPPLVTTFTLTPAGSHRGDAIVPQLIAAKEAGQDIADVVWDRGYSQSRPETTSHPLNRAGIHQTFLPKGRQRDPRTFSGDAVLIEGQLFSAHVPKELRRTLPMPPMGATPDEVANYEKPFNRRARFRFQRLSGPDGDGTTRWKCPYHAGLLRSRSLPRTMRSSRAVPLEELPAGVACCSGTKSVPAADLPLAQKLTVGTTAWRQSMGRRQYAETANGLLKGGFVNIERKFFRVLGLTKVTVLLAFTLVGYNLDRIRSFLASKAAAAARLAGRRPRARRRRGTWTDLLGPQNAAIGSDASGAQTAGAGPDPPPPT